MAMKMYSAFPKAPALLKPDHKIVSCHIQDILWESLTSLLRCSWCIPQPQPNGQKSVGSYCIYHLFVRVDVEFKNFQKILLNWNKTPTLLASLTIGYNPYDWQQFSTMSLVSLISNMHPASVPKLQVNGFRKIKDFSGLPFSVKLPDLNLIEHLLNV